MLDKRHHQVLLEIVFKGIRRATTQGQRQKAILSDEVGFQLIVVESRAITHLVEVRTLKMAILGLTGSASFVYSVLSVGRSESQHIASYHFVHLASSPSQYKGGSYYSKPGSMQRWRLVLLFLLLLQIRLLVSCCSSILHMPKPRLDAWYHLRKLSPVGIVCVIPCGLGGIAVGYVLPTHYCDL